MSKKAAVAGGAPGGQERRRSKRRPIVDSFSMFVVVPRKGPHRLRVHDVSDQGVGFDFDIEGEVAGDFPVKSGECFEMRLYLNQTLYLPMTIEVVRITDEGSSRRVGAEVRDRDTQAYKAYLSFVQMLDSISDAVRFDDPSGL